MNLEDLSLQDITELIRLWGIHLGYFFDKRYERNPELLLEEIKDPGCWVCGTRYETRVGSRFGDDAKILVYERAQGIEILADINDGNLKRDIANTSLAEFVRERKKQELVAENSFNEAMRKYLETR